MEDSPSPSEDTPIPDDAELWRRVPPMHWIPLGAPPSERRVSSAAFADEEMSVVVASACTGGEPTLLKGHDGFGIARFTAGDVRLLDSEVVWAPDDNLPGHAHVLELRGKGNRRRLAKACRVDPRPTEE